MAIIPRKPANQSSVERLEYYKRQAERAGNYYAQLMGDDTCEDWELNEASDALDYWLKKIEQEELFQSGY